MKKLFNLLAICCLSVFLLGACESGSIKSESSSIKVTSQNSTVYDSYQEACTAQDFAAAHVFLDRMKAKASEMPSKTEKEKERKNDAEKRVEEALEYITNREVLFLMSLDDETAFNRITFLLKEGDLSEVKNDEFCDMVVDLGIDMNKLELVKRMTRFYKSNISESMLNKIVQFLYIESDGENLDFVKALLNRYDKDELLFHAALEKGDDDVIENYVKNYNGTVVNEEELFDWLASKNTKKYSDMIMGSLLSQKTNITNKPKMGINSFCGTGYNTSAFERECNDYIKSVKNYNDLCLKTLSMAIKYKNQYLAQRAGSSSVQSIRVEDLGWLSDRVTYRYKVVSDDSDIQAAKSTLNEAVRNGAFK